MEGDISAFDDKRKTKLQSALALELVEDMDPNKVKIKILQATPKVLAKIGTRRCRLKVEVDREGFAESRSMSKGRFPAVCSFALRDTRMTQQQVQLR